LGEKILDPACGTGGFLTCTIEHLKKQSKNIEDLSQLTNVIGWEYKPLPFLLATTNLILHDVEVPNITFGDTLSREYTSYREADRVNIIIANPPFGGVVANSNENNFPLNYRTRESADLFLVLIINLLKKEGGRAGIVLPDGSLTGEGVKQRVRQRLLEECNLHTIVRLPNSVFQPYATVATNLLFFDKGKPTKEVWYYEHRLPEGQKSYSKTKTIQAREFDPIKAWWNNRQESDQSWKVPIETIISKGYDLDFKNPTKVVEDSIKDSKDIISELKSSFSRCQDLLEELNTSKA
jgi:type I restriction enzyme M protein